MAKFTEKELNEMPLSDLEQLAREEGNIDFIISYALDICLTNDEQREVLKYTLLGE